MDLVPVDDLIQLLLRNNPDVGERRVCTELAAALNRAGYPFTTVQVAARDAAAMLEVLDRGIVKSSPDQRFALRESTLPF